MGTGINTASAYSYRTPDPALQQPQSVEQEETIIASASTPDTETEASSGISTSSTPQDQMARANLPIVGENGWSRSNDSAGKAVIPEKLSNLNGAARNPDGSPKVWYTPTGTDDTDKIYLSGPYRVQENGKTVFKRDIAVVNENGVATLIPGTISGPSEDAVFNAALGREGGDGGLGKDAENGGLTVLKDNEGRYVLAQNDVNTGNLSNLTRVEAGDNGVKINTEKFDAQGNFVPDSGRYIELDAQGKEKKNQAYFWNSGQSHIVQGFFGGSNDIHRALQHRSDLAQQHQALFNDDQTYQEQIARYYQTVNLRYETYNAEQQSVFANEQQEETWASLQEQANLQNRRDRAELNASDVPDARREELQQQITRREVALSLNGINTNDLDPAGVRQLQEKLKAFNPNLVVDGRLGPDTEAALKLALGNELPEDGEIDTDYIAGVLGTSENSTVASDGAESETTTG